MLVGSVLAAVPFVVAAYGSPLVGRNPKCSVNNMTCCDSTHAPGSASADGLMGLLSLLSLNLTSPLSNIGLGCTPLTVVGAGSGAGCQANPVCCTGQSFNRGLINMDCSPINFG